MKEQGIVYVLTNPCMPGIVKIGMTEKQSIEKRMKDLYGTGVPLPFECKFACYVKASDCKQLEQALHTAFAPQRVNANREFFKIAPEQAIAILKVFQQKNATDEVTQEIENDLTPDDKAAQEKAKTKRPPLDFFEMGLHKDDALVYKHDVNIKCYVYDNRHVTYNGNITSLSPLTANLLGGVAKYVQPTPHWYVGESGELLSDLYDSTYPMEDAE
jgi:hypothetical protein